ncbi:glycosyl transferase family 2 [Thalassobacillus devorans]|uniref:Glycosyl transferase family 2 n=1 Tax=Thalassobacillus devorans TaxID=279813 RepID=A0ABQ1NVK2_9BACI|nr:glycosyltransferase [Thalassobacillus devorans]NIK28687.1 cellulose synthase/poly-beta-1,6-N-acetylglucosamine synthase-like glycosyltransferase [Thalassobacillus devorans]GGC84314.1 glycosyl transferase family 2 [Thalassobacillus devorans]
MMLTTTFILFGLFIVFRLFYIFVPIFSIKNNDKLQLLNEEKGITVLVPAYNEEAIITDCLKGLLNVNYKNFEAIFINDGSGDRTFSVLEEILELNPLERVKAGELSHKPTKGIYQSDKYPHIYVIDKINGGKADALNAGIELTSNEIIVTLDADSILDTNALQAVNTTFEEDRVIAAGGMVQISQGYRGSHKKPTPVFSTSGLIRFQIIQYMTDFYLHKFTQSKMGAITVIAGAFGAFRRHALFEVDGYRNTVGEDMDITLKIQKLLRTKYKNKKMVIMSHALCFTECPATFIDLYRQRIRWQKAFIDCIWTYKYMFFRKLRFLPSLYLLLDSLILGTLCAFIVLTAPFIIILNPSNFIIALGLFTLAYVIALYQGAAALFISRRYGVSYTKNDYMRVVMFLPFEIISYRLLGLLFVSLGTILYLKNKKGWAASRRVGVSYQTFE